MIKQKFSILFVNKIHDQTSIHGIVHHHSEKVEVLQNIVFLLLDQPNIPQHAHVAHRPMCECRRRHGQEVREHVEPHSSFCHLLEVYGCTSDALCPSLSPKRFQKPTACWDQCRDAQAEHWWLVTYASWAQNEGVGVWGWEAWKWVACWSWSSGDGWSNEESCRCHKRSPCTPFSQVSTLSSHRPQWERWRACGTVVDLESFRWNRRADRSAPWESLCTQSVRLADWSTSSCQGERAPRTFSASRECWRTASIVGLRLPEQRRDSWGILVERR